MSVHIISVGTSVLRNFARETGAIEPAVLEIGETGSKDIHEDKLIEEMLKYIKKDPERASAELNAFIKKLEQEPESEPEKVVLLCTDTDAGRIACKTIKAYLEGEGYGTSAYVISSLGVPGKFYEGLINLMCAFPKILDKEAECEDKCVYVNPTGGFKPESAVIYMLALTHPKVVDVYYVHEAFRDVVSLPLVPVIKSPIDILEKAKIHAKGDEVVERLKRCLSGSAYTPWKPLF